MEQEPQIQLYHGIYFRTGNSHIVRCMLTILWCFTCDLQFASIHSFIKVTDWNVIPTDDLDKQPLFLNFTSNPEDRQPVEDLAELPLLDGQDCEIPVYTMDGFRVLRRHPVASERLGCLLDLTKVPGLFFPDSINVVDDPDSRTSIYLYPLAFTKTMGNMQADGVLHSFQRRMVALNGTLMVPQARNEVDDQSDDDSLLGEDTDNAIAGSASPAIRALRCQAYSTLSHEVRQEAQFHSVQLGKITATLAGCGSCDEDVTEEWKRRRDYCAEALPHQRFDSKINGRSLPQAMRFENVYKLNLARMKPEYRNGRFVFSVTDTIS